MKIKIEINSTDNAAFDDGVATEIARILRDLADKIDKRGIDETGDFLPLLDINGNTVGAFKAR